jgi:hypothetical protein
VERLDQGRHLDGGGNVLNDVVHGFRGDLELSQIHIVHIHIQVSGLTLTTGRQEKYGSEQKQNLFYHGNGLYDL